MAERWQIYVTDKWGKRLQLTENVAYFNLFVDPKFVKDKAKVIDVLVPIVYEHFCRIYGLEQVDKQACIENIEVFTDTAILPEREGVFITSGNTQYYIDAELYQEEMDEAIAWVTEEQMKQLLHIKLSSALEWGIKVKNYLGFYDLPNLLEELSLSPYVDIVDNYYIYIVPNLVSSKNTALKDIQRILKKYGYYYEDAVIKPLFDVQEIRYVKLLTAMNAKIAKQVKDAKGTYFEEKIDGVPLLHWLGLEEYKKRYYPHDTFMSNIVGYVDKRGQSYYGIEEYFEQQLAGKDGKIIWLATPWIWQVGANSFQIEEPIHGVDMYLTIDPVIQKEVLSWARYYQKYLSADAIAVTILDPHTGKVKALVNYPEYNPNIPEQYYALRPLTYDERYLIENETYIDVPVFILSWEDLRQALVDERNDPQYQKYIFENLIWPQVFVDKNIAFPYEPGSIFKPLTLWIAIDSDALSMFDFYNDPGFVMVWQYPIANISSECEGDHTYLHALEFSCNVGMVRIAQAMTKYVFYSYLQKLGFGELTSIELAGEDGWTLPDFNFVSLARFFNNTYGQWLLATPLQMAVAYASLVNGGKYIKPTIVEAIYDPNLGDYIKLSDTYQGQVFKPSTSVAIKDALVSVVDNGNLREVRKEWYSLWGKTWTSEIAFRGEYQWGHGWTNGSFVGIITAKHTKYVVAIQVRRPRSSPWWLDTAWRVFSSIADFLLSYERIEK